MLVLKQLFSLRDWCITRTAGCFYQKVRIWINYYDSRQYFSLCNRAQSFKAACLHHKCDFFFPHLTLLLYSSLISLLLWLFSYLHKNPEINYICLTSRGLLSFCHLQTSMSSTMWCIQGASLAFWEERESPFLLLLAPIQAFLLPFKWAVDEVSLIRLSQLTLVCAVCFPPKGVLTSPMLFSFILLFALFNQASTQGKKKKKPFSCGPNGLLYTPRSPQWYRLFRMGH